MPPFGQIQKYFPKLFGKLKSHEHEFFWIKNNYYTVEYYGVREVYLKLKSVDPKEHKNRQQQTAALRAQRRGLMASLAKGSILKNLAEISELFSHWKDVRKSGVYLGMHHFDRFLGEIARRTKIQKADLNFLTFDEIKDLFRHEKSFGSEIAARKQQVFFTVTPQGHFIAGGKKASLYFKLLDASQNTKSTNLKGVCACPGLVKGRVRIVKNSQAMSKFKPGEILVTNQTTPDFVPIMKKAAGIITEQGGITSHAAIVCRELNIPCVIGTKVATQALKDGDWVEMDASSGRVRKL